MAYSQNDVFMTSCLSRTSDRCQEMSEFKVEKYFWQFEFLIIIIILIITLNKKGFRVTICNYRNTWLLI